MKSFDNIGRLLKCRKDIYSENGKGLMLNKDITPLTFMTQKQQSLLWFHDSLYVISTSKYSKLAVFSA